MNKKKEKYNFIKRMNFEYFFNKIIIRRVSNDSKRAIKEIFVKKNKNKKSKIQNCYSVILIK